MTGGTEVIRPPPDPLKIRIEGRAEAGAQLGKGGSVGAGEGTFLLRDLRSWLIEDAVRGTG